MLAVQGETLLRLPGERVEVVNTTGSGDAAAAAMVWAGVQGFDLEKSARAAQLAGALTCQCLEANSSALTKLPEQFGMRSSESGIDP